jgi:predicted nucleotidyltransferase
MPKLREGKQDAERDRISKVSEDKALLPTHQLLVHTLKKRLEEVAGEKLQAVILYGSRAWGHPDHDSDLDVAAIVRECTPQLERALWEAAYQVMWDHDFTPLISLKVFDAGSFAAYREKGFSFYRRVAEEGIIL